MAKSNPPVKKFRVGVVNVTVWKNDGPKGPLFSANMERRYKDGEEWKSSTSFLIPGHLDDLAAAVEMLRSFAPLLKRIEAGEQPPEETGKTE